MRMRGSPSCLTYVERRRTSDCLVLLVLSRGDAERSLLAAWSHGTPQKLENQHYLTFLGEVGLLSFVPAC